MEWTEDAAASRIVRGFLKRIDLSDWPCVWKRFLRNCLWQEGDESWQDPFAFCERERLLAVMSEATDADDPRWDAVVALLDRYMRFVRRPREGPYEDLAGLLRGLIIRCDDCNGDVSSACQACQRATDPQINDFTCRTCCIVRRWGDCPAERDPPKPIK
jgi:hypothetical protein